MGMVADVVLEIFKPRQRREVTRVVRFAHFNANHLRVRGDAYIVCAYEDRPVRIAFKKKVPCLKRQIDQRCPLGVTQNTLPMKRRIAQRMATIASRILQSGGREEIPVNVEGLSTKRTYLSLENECQRKHLTTEFSCLPTTDRIV